MIRRPSPGFFFTLCYALLFAGVISLVPLAANESLLANSPFLPPGFGEQPQKPEAAAPDPGPLAKTVEFRSVARIGGEWHFSLFNREKKQGVWVQIAEEGSPYQISEYDPDENRVRLSFNDRSEWLPLKEAAATAARPEVQKPVLRSPGIQPSRTSQSQRPRLNRRRVPSRRQVTVPRRETDNN